MVESSRSIWWWSSYVQCNVIDLLQRQCIKVILCQYYFEMLICASRRGMNESTTQNVFSYKIFLSWNRMPENVLKTKSRDRQQKVCDSSNNLGMVNSISWAVRMNSNCPFKCITIHVGKRPHISLRISCHSISFSANSFKP